MTTLNVVANGIRQIEIESFNFKLVTEPQIKMQLILVVSKADDYFWLIETEQKWFGVTIELFVDEAKFPKLDFKFKDRSLTTLTFTGEVTFT